MNGPNISKSLWEKVNQKMVALGFNALLSLVMYNLHTVHKAFQHGCTECRSEVERMPIDLHEWFKIAPCKREDINAVSIELDEANPLFQRIFG